MNDVLALLDDYDFELPEALIAQRPAETRESARMLVVDRPSGRILASQPGHRVSALPDWLRPGDLLVVNATRVLAARLVGRKASGGSAEALLLEPSSAPGPGDASRGQTYRALLKCTGRLREGLVFHFGDVGGDVGGEVGGAVARSVGDASGGDGWADDRPSTRTVSAELIKIHERGEVSLRFEAGVDPYSAGRAPLPPYIQRRRADEADHAFDEERYQTVFAREPGAIAAPTAGLHLSESLLESIDARGVERAEVILHVGAGTFRPLDRNALESGRLHEERYVLPPETADAIDRTRRRGGRVWAVGTTTTRVLESCATEAGRVRPGSGTTDLFIQPGGQGFRVVDGLLTNFHLPRSSLLLLVAAFIGRRPLLDAYRIAIESGFRFYSYGDAMLIRPSEGEPQTDGMHGGLDG